MSNRLFIVLLLSALVSFAVCAAGPPGSYKGYDPVDDPFNHRAQTDYRVVWHDFSSTTEDLLKTVAANVPEAVLNKTVNDLELSVRSRKAATRICARSRRGPCPRIPC